MIAPSSMKRSAAGAVVIPAVFAGMLAFSGPASAESAPPGGICNGVTNQLAHRGSVQENLLRAAARKNAELITKLQAERATLQTSADTLKAQIATANQDIARLDAENAKLDADIAVATTELGGLTAKQAETTAAITDAEKALAGLDAAGRGRGRADPPPGAAGGSAGRVRLADRAGQGRRGRSRRQAA
ncbi:MAG: hypothetical protein M3Q47_20695 [Actinomycetota bacterium]|nr:hypothetical protein [Actinomycetota bacterium]